jgi:hypothetical protein
MDSQLPSLLRRKHIGLLQHTPRHCTVPALPQMPGHVWVLDG